MRSSDKLSAKERKDAFKDHEADSKPLETIFNRIPQFLQACDPSNVIWENRHVKAKQFQRNFIKSLGIMGVVLAFFFFAILFFKI